MFRRPLLIAALFASLALSATAQDTTREITNVKGDVWRFENNFH